MRPGIILLLTAAFLFSAALPIRLDDSINLVPPAVNSDGTTVLFGAGAPPGAKTKGTNLFLFRQPGAALRQLTSYSADTNFTGVTGVSLGGSLAGYSALPGGIPGVEEVHTVDLNTLADRTVAVDKEGCIQPLCVNCFFACIGPVHVSPDGKRVVYNARRQQPFYVVGADGSGAARLPVYQGALAPSPQSVISRDGTLVFTSAAPSGPTFAAAATDVYAIGLDGSGLRPVTRFGNFRFFATDAVISPDGAWIAFASNYSPSGDLDVYQIWAVRSDGTGLTRLSNGADAASGPSISADGTSVTWLQSGQIWRARVGGGAPLALTQLTGSVPFDPVITGDGLQTVFTLAPRSGNAAAIYRIPTGSTTRLENFYPIYTPQYLNPNGIASASGFGSPSPGSLITLYGANLGRSELEAAASFPLPSTLNGLSLLVNDVALPLLAVTPWQVNAQLPQSVAPGMVTFQLRSGTTVTAVDAMVKSASPSNFTYPATFHASGYTQAAAYHAGTAIPADMEHPAGAGELLEVYAAGLGVTDPPVAAGMPSPSSPPARARALPRIQIGGRDAVVEFAGLTPGFAGLYQVNLRVPQGLAPGLQPFGWRDADVAIYSSIAVK